MFCKTNSLEVFCKAAVITFVETDFGRKKGDNYFSKETKKSSQYIKVSLTPSMIFCMCNIWVI
jgi:hypothetical protein